MVQTDQIITLLQALVSSGGIAVEMQGRVSTAQAELASNPALVKQISENAALFVNREIADAATDILSSGGDLTTIGDSLDNACSIGLMAGLATAAVCARDIVDLRSSLENRYAEEADMKRNTTEPIPDIPPEVLARRDRYSARQVARYERDGLFAMASIAKVHARQHSALGLSKLESGSNLRRCWSVPQSMPAYRYIG